LSDHYVAHRELFSIRHSDKEFSTGSAGELEVAYGCA
jgi:hypothetical protein